MWKNVKQIKDERTQRGEGGMRRIPPSRKCINKWSTNQPNTNQGHGQMQKSNTSNSITASIKIIIISIFRPCIVCVKVNLFHMHIILNINRWNISPQMHRNLERTSATTPKSCKVLTDLNNPLTQPCNMLPNLLWCEQFSQRNTFDFWFSQFWCCWIIRWEYCCCDFLFKLSRFRFDQHRFFLN